MSARTLLRVGGVLLIAAVAYTTLDSVWFRAQLGGTDSQLKLAYAYATGSGIDIDQEKASEWYRRAAEQGDPRGQLALAARYDQGLGVPIDPVAATRWYERAASSGIAAAQLAMAIRSHHGRGTPKDDVRSAMWLILSDRYAVTRNEGVALLEVLKASLDEEQLAEAQRSGDIWWAAHPGAMRRRGARPDAQSPLAAPEGPLAAPEGPLPAPEGNASPPSP